MSRPGAAHHCHRTGALLALTLVGCVPPAPSGNPQPPWSLNNISRAEIELAATPYTSAYEVVRTLRPGMLASRGATRGVQSPTSLRSANAAIKVYVDGIPFGGVESLTMIPAWDVREVRWLSAIDATTRFGSGNTGGAIVVTTQSGRK